MARPDIWAADEAQGGSIPAVGLRPTSNEVSSPKIGRSPIGSYRHFLVFPCFFPRLYAAAGIYELTSKEWIGADMTCQEVLPIFNPMLLRMNGSAKVALPVWGAARAPLKNDGIGGRHKKFYNSACLI
jgi:hypothetical protein